MKTAQTTEPPEAVRQVLAIVSRLDATDIAVLKACKKYGYTCGTSDPRTGQMPPSEWLSWKKLSRLRLGEIQGMGEADDFAINDLGRKVLKSC